MKIKKLFAPIKIAKAYKDESGTMTVEGYGSAFNVLDSDNDVVVTGAYERSIKERVPKNLVKFLWQHDHLKPIGTFSEMREDETGLFFKAIIVDTELGLEAYKLLKSRTVDRFSIGFEVVKSRVAKASELGIDGVDHDVNVLEEVKLYEISAVTFAANEEARLVRIKTKNGKWSVIRSQKAMEAGAFVSWSDGHGVIESITTEPIEAEDGTTVQASADEPVAIINVWSETEGVWAATGEVVAVPVSELTEEAMPSDDTGSSDSGDVNIDETASKDDEDNPDIDDEVTPGDHVPPVDASETAQEALDALGGDAGDIDPSIIDAAERIASGEPLTGDEVVSIASFWVEHREELLTGADAEHETVAELLGGSDGADWFPFELGVMAVTGELDTEELQTSSKAARVLSSRNKNRLNTAVKLLREVLKEANGGRNPKPAKANATKRARLSLRNQTKSSNVNTRAEAAKVNALLNDISKVFSIKGK